MLPYALLLHAFCLVDPTLCVPASDPSQFVVTLQPYLKNQSDDRVTAQLLESILFLIDFVLPLLHKLPQTVCEELEQDLKQMIVQHSFLTVVHACIKCLCSVGEVAGKGARVVEYLIQLFYKRLDALGFDNKQQVGRSLFCLGLLIHYSSSLLVASSSNTRMMDVTSSVNLFKKYLQAEDFIIKVRSLQALGYVLIARPEFMLQKDVGKIVEATFSSNTDAGLKADCLASGAIQLLLKLKRHLKIVFSLDYARCQAYSPNEPPTPKPGESLLQQNISFNISNVNIDPPNTSEDFLRRYQDFKNALKEDTVDYSTYTANIKRKRPPPRRGGKASRMAEKVV